MSSLLGDIAIIGMACTFPGAPNVEAYWQNIVSKVDAISDPPEGWGAEDVFDRDSTTNDRVYCKKGGYLGDLAQFNPLDYGIMPRAVDGGEPEHFLALRAAHEALADAGYLDRPFDRDRIAVILGRGTFLNRGNVTALQHGLIVDQTLRLLKQLRPEYSEEDLQTIKRELKASLPPFNTDTAPGLVSNIMCGRIANRLNLRGPNYAVDAACASSLIAMDLGMRELLSGRCDLALVGGVSVSTPSIVFMVFCQLGALSRRGQIRPFDKDADGVLLGEGLGMAVLKRRADAERDGDRIYAIIKGVGISSDGRGLGVLAPQVEGEELALRRAYEATGISPRSIELIEAHGTGTLVGDLVEIQALSRVFGPRDGAIPWCAVGSVKSMISHTIPAAGIAGLIKAALALYHKCLPPTLNCDEPNPKFELEKTPFYINTETRPWIHGSPTPRRAGVNAFGFGGINVHTILEEYTGPVGNNVPSLLHRWDTEVFILQGVSRQDLIRAGERLLHFFSSGPEPEPKDLAYTLNCPLKESGYRLAIVADSLKDFKEKLAYGLQRLADPRCTKIKDRSGIFFFEEPLSRAGTLAFLFPGEGSQYVNMLSDICLHFPEARACFDRADRVFFNNKRNLLPSQVVFPPTLVESAADKPSSQELWRTDCAVAAVFAADQALFVLLNHLGIQPRAVVGHSSGEYAALLASGAVEIQDEDQLLQHGLDLNGIYESLADQIPETLLMAVGAADPTIVPSVVSESDGVLYVTMDNCPHQVILCGAETAVTRVRERLQSQGTICTLLPFNRAYHTPLFQPVCDQLAPFFKRLRIVPPRTTIYSCMTAQPFPQDPDGVRRLAVKQWARPVRFRETIEAMYDAGVRMFVEVGPRGNLTAFVEDILRGRSFLAVPSNVSHRSGITQLNHLIGLLAAHGVPMRLDYLYARRTPCRLSFEATGEHPVTSGEGTVPMRVALELPRLRLRQGVQPSTPELPPSSPRAFSTTGDPVVLAQSRETLTRALLNQLVVPATPSPSSALPIQRGFRSQVMEEYLQTMERFLATQREAMVAFMAGTGTVRSEPSAVKEEGAGPFDISVSSLIPGEEVVAVCQLDLDEHPFFRHHTIGGSPSTLDDTLTALPVVPLSVSLEMMAQIAALLLPGKRLIAMKNVRAHRWIVVEEKCRTLLLTARHRSSETGGEVEVRIWEAAKAADSEYSEGPLILEGTIVFGDGYPDPPLAEVFSLRSERPYRFRPEQYYREVMFHGPSFQSIVSIDRCGEDGAEATVKVPVGVELFRSRKNPRLLTDPVLLDAAGQVIGFWTADHFETRFVVFPIGFEALYIYGPWPLGSEPLKCRARTAALPDGRVRSNIDFVTSSDRLLVRLVAWEDMRFDFPRQFVRFVLSPRDVMLSTSWSLPIAHLPTSSEFRCCRLEGFPDALFEAEGAVWPRAWARIILSRRERETWLRLTGPEKRRKEWLLGRLAAKDAVRLFLKERYRLELSPADIEIVTDEHGRPMIGGELLEKLGCRLSLSIAHSGGVAAAVAGECGNHRGVGIDVEHIGRSRAGLERVALTAEEQVLLSTIPASRREEWLLRLWCAKEAVAKALGRGMGSPLNLIVQELKVETGRVDVELAGELARQFPDSAGMLFTSCTGCEGDLVFASSLV